MNVEFAGEILLADSGRHTKQTENTCIGRSKSKNLQPFGELGGCMGANLRQQESSFWAFPLSVIHSGNYCMKYSFMI